MKIKLEVKDQQEGKAIKRGLEDKESRALVVVIGLLLSLDTNRARARVLNFVADKLDETPGL